MPYTRTSRPKSHGEFSGGPEFIDPQRKLDRVVGTETFPMAYQNPGEELAEIYATNPADPDSEQKDGRPGYVPPNPKVNPDTAIGTA